MIPVSDLIARIRIKYESGSGGSSVRWTDARLLDLVNEGLENLAESTGFYERYCTIPLQANRIWYDLRGFTPETVVRIKSIWSTNRTAWLYHITEDKLTGDWEAATGEPESFFVRGIYWLGVWPHPGSDATGYIRVYFSGIPPRFVNTQMVLRELPDDMWGALEDYVLYEMFAIDREPKKAIKAWQSYMEQEKRLHDFVDRRLVGSKTGRIGGLQGGMVR